MFETRNNLQDWSYWFRFLTFLITYDYFKALLPQQIMQCKVVKSNATCGKERENNIRQRITVNSEKRKLTQNARLCPHECTKHVSTVRSYLHLPPLCGVTARGWKTNGHRQSKWREIGNPFNTNSLHSAHDRKTVHEKAPFPGDFGRWNHTRDDQPVVSIR